MALRPQIILFGDSITQKSFTTDGWGSHLVAQYARKVDVVLRGYSGYNTRWATYLLDKIFPIPSANPPLVVTVFFGANDAALPDRACKDSHVPLTEYTENLHRIVAHLKKQSNSTHIVLITPPPVDITGCMQGGELTIVLYLYVSSNYFFWAVNCTDLDFLLRSLYGDKADPLPERTNETTRLYAEACVAVAKETGASVLNIWSIFQQTDNWGEKFLCDGLHFTREGNVRLFEELRNLLEELGLPWDKLPWDFPEPINIDKKHPAKTFGALLN
ncbi:unnamed protein product [Calypogeia fissa]